MFLTYRAENPLPKPLHISHALVCCNMFFIVVKLHFNIGWPLHLPLHASQTPPQIPLAPHTHTYIRMQQTSSPPPVFLVAFYNLVLCLRQRLRSNSLSNSMYGYAFPLCLLHSFLAFPFSRIFSHFSACLPLMRIVTGTGAGVTTFLSLPRNENSENRKQ